MCPKVWFRRSCQRTISFSVQRRSIELLEEITNRLNGEALPDAWSVIVQKGSQILNATPHYTSLESKLAGYTQAMMNGFDNARRRSKAALRVYREST